MFIVVVVSLSFSPTFPTDITLARPNDKIPVSPIKIKNSSISRDKYCFAVSYFWNIGMEMA